MSDTGKSALIIGATGQVGRHLLRELIASPHFTRVGEAGRRVTPLAPLASAGDTGKLEQMVVNFETKDELESALRKGKWDVVFITLGTNARDAGSPANFEKIDREYVLNAAKAAKSTEEGHSQRLVYCGSMSANPKSSLLYSRSKGLTEQGLASLGYSDTIIFRPGKLQNLNREHPHRFDNILSPIARGLSYFTSSFGIDVDVLAKSMRIAGQVGSEGLPDVAAAYKTEWSGPKFTAIGNKGSVLLSEEAL